MTPIKKTQRNLIRVFLSSTFRDMTAEREHLNKVIFPEVRQLTRERGVEFTAIDLRWGVTEDEANQGDVVSICLEEIDRCNPFFMGFLGERYGWAPKPEDVRYYERLTERFPITETSLQAGLLQKGAFLFYSLFLFVHSPWLPPPDHPRAPCLRAELYASLGS